MSEVMEAPSLVLTVPVDNDEGEHAEIPCSLIDQDFNYRRRYRNLESLAVDIKLRGLTYRIDVRLRSDGRYQLLVGNRRFRAFVLAHGIDALIKVRIKKMSDTEAVGLMMSENGNREDPSAIEDAEGAARMLGLCNGNRDEAASALGWKRDKLDRRLAIMNAHQVVRDAYLDEKIHLGHVEILAALRDDVQQRVMEKILASGKIPTVEQLKAVAEQALLNLETAIFDKADCKGCKFNTGFQQAMFEQSFSGSRCTNKECFSKKTEAELDTRKSQLEETYQVVRIVRPGDNSTVIALSATDGKRAVGAEQLAACRTCGDFGACVSGVPDSLGKVYRGGMRAVTDLSLERPRPIARCGTEVMLARTTMNRQRKPPPEPRVVQQRRTPRRRSVHRQTRYATKSGSTGKACGVPSISVRL